MRLDSNTRNDKKEWLYLKTEYKVDIELDILELSNCSRLLRIICLIMNMTEHGYVRLSYPPPTLTLDIVYATRHNNWLSSLYKPVIIVRD